MLFISKESNSKAIVSLPQIQTQVSLCRVNRAIVEGRRGIHKKLVEIFRTHTRNRKNCLSIISIDAP